MNRPVFQATNEGKAARNTDECSLTQWRLVPEFSERRRGERENLQLAARAVLPFLCVGYVCKEISWVLSCSHFIIWHPVMRCCERRCWSADVRTCSTGTSMCAFTKTQTALHGAHLGVFAVATLRACCTAQSFRQLVASHLNMYHFHFLNSYAQMLERSVYIYIYISNEVLLPKPFKLPKFTAWRFVRIFREISLRNCTKQPAALFIRPSSVLVHLTKFIFRNTNKLSQVRRKTHLDTGI